VISARREARPAARPTELVLCAEASPSVGAGHVMRLLVLAEAWQRLGFGRVSLFGDAHLDFVRHRVAALGVGVRHELPTGLEAVLVVDTYDPERRARLGESGTGNSLRVLVDDLGEPVPKGYDLVWNPNAYGSPALYPGFTGEVVTGPDSVPIRRGLPAWRGAGAGSTGVMLGGAPPPPPLREAVALLAERIGHDNVVGTGTSVPQECRRVEATDPWSGLAGCARLVTAAGSSVWEAANVGIPVVVVQTASNQALVFEWAGRGGAPRINALAFRGGIGLADALGDALDAAARLPEIRSGADSVARRILEAFAGEGL
jgi:hypothetical protein